ncbi:MAG: single-stranded-DNA-specific exonuclease RecJ [Hyphomicrobiales bacterium]
MEKRWVLKEESDKEQVRRLSKELNTPTILTNLLIQRGIKSYDQAKSFFRPELSHLHDPFLMKDMDKAVIRINKAIQRGERILIYGDYDVDGTTSVALVYNFLSTLHSKLDYYIPDRYNEGYGISYKGIDFASQNNFSLVIALDCGIKAIEKMEYAKKKRIDFIICDHHRPDNILPKAAAILNPRRLDCDYPYKELSGCGVGFKLIQALAQKNKIPFSSLKKYLDLTAISIASDIVPITGENRILAFYGLKLMNFRPRPGIVSLLEKYGKFEKNTNKDYRLFFKREITINDLIFLIGPKINAAGRLENGKNSVDLLVSKTSEVADSIARQINDLNTVRRNLDNQTTQEALFFISKDKEHPSRKTTIVYNEKWHKGVIGIVASRLMDHFYRPTLVLTKSNGFITGSARSIKDFDVYEAIDHCSDLLEHFGGHKYAAGLSIKPENLPAFKERFNSFVENKISEKILTPIIEIDANIDLSVINGIDSKFFNVLKQFAPFGPGNPSPIFCTNGIKDTGYARIVGQKHLKMKVTSAEEGEQSPKIDAIAFQQGDEVNYKWISKMFPFSICYQIEENAWLGKIDLQLNVKDIKLEM